MRRFGYSPFFGRDQLGNLKADGGALADAAFDIEGEFLPVEHLQPFAHVGDPDSGVKHFVLIGGGKPDAVI